MKKLADMSTVSRDPWIISGNQGTDRRGSSTAQVLRGKIASPVTGHCPSESMDSMCCPQEVLHVIRRCLEVLKNREPPTQFFFKKVSEQYLIYMHDTPW